MCTARGRFWANNALITPKTEECMHVISGLVATSQQHRSADRRTLQHLKNRCDLIAACYIVTFHSGVLCITSTDEIMIVVTFTEAVLLLGSQHLLSPNRPV